MALISQIISASYPAILAEKRKPANQWAESALLREVDRQGGIEQKPLGATIDVPLDYQANQGAVIQSTDLQPLSMTKTEVVTTATYDIAEITAPIVWSKKDDVMNPSENQKISLATTRISNAIESHDDLIERCFFTTSTNGLLGLLTHIVDAGTGSDGGIDSTVSTFWRNQNSTYVDDTDIEAAFTSVWNACAKGSGSALLPTLMVSDSATQALFEGTQQANQRYADQDLKAGFKTLMFKTARYVFSQYGTTRVFFANMKNLKLVFSSNALRDLDKEQPLINANGYVRKVYSAGQFVTDNRSRLGVAHV